MTGSSRDGALDHVVVMAFENRSFDNLLGRLYHPGEVASFEGVIGRDLSNPIPSWAENGAERKVVPYGVPDSMDTPNPDPGEEYQHVNTQLFGIVDPEDNRCRVADDMVAPYQVRRLLQGVDRGGRAAGRQERQRHAAGPPAPAGAGDRARNLSVGPLSACGFVERCMGEKPWTVPSTW